ncbi:hypothetical protein [Halomarina pelagica]|uniref:hypothetical protein n=1 Tax=Halomarina pelagica TaxID=2961599 RepID=UPI0020C5A3D8|nr:hypothetical protein [Halomarina sp. BND7]
MNAESAEGRHGDARPVSEKPTDASDTSTASDVSDASDEPDASNASDASNAPVASASRVLGEAASIERRELDRALARLDDRGELTDERRAVLADLADALVAELVAVPLGRAAGAGSPPVAGDDGGSLDARAGGSGDETPAGAGADEAPRDLTLRRAVELFLGPDRLDDGG